MAKYQRVLFFGLAAVALTLAGAGILLPFALEKLNPAVTYRLPNSGKTLYLTLDDGPSEETTRILAVLRRHEVKATFFVITNRIRADWMKEILADGHQVAHHMPTSSGTRSMSLERFQAEFLAADRALAAYPHVKLFRPPNGAISRVQASFVTSQGYRPVVGTIFPLDHWLENETVIVALARFLVTDGGIIILHDTRERGARTAAVLDELISQLKRKGYQFALLPETGET